MSWRIPCNATEGRFYNGGKVCSKCDICPGGQGRDMSKRVLNTSETHGDLECIKCEVCPLKTYNNGGREGCKKCLDDCALRNRHDCPEKATRLCGECLDGYFEDYQIEDNPSTCIPCTEKEKSIISACANFTTAPSAINTTHLSSKATTYLYIENRAITKDNHVFRENIPVQNKAIESNNENSPTQNGYWFPSFLELGTITTVLVVFWTIWVICRYYKKRRQRQSGTNQGNRTGVPGDGAPLAGSGNSFNSPLLAGASGNYVDGPLIAGTSANSFHSQLQAGTSGNSVDSPLLAGTYGNIVYNPILSGNSGNDPLLACTFRNPVDIPLLEVTSEILVGFPLPDNASRISGDSSLLEGSNRNIADANKMAFDDFTLVNDLETDANPVPKGMDRNRWIYRRELLKSNISIHQLCAKRWIALDSEYPVLSMPNEEVELLKKEAHSKLWTPQELNFQILSRWAQIKGNQATVQALCDALFTKGHYDIIEDIMRIHEMKLN